MQRSEQLPAGYMRYISFYSLIQMFCIYWVQGVFWGLVVGLVVGITRMALDWSHPPSDCGSGGVTSQLNVVSKVHFLHFALIVAAVCLFVMVTVSYLTKPRRPSQVSCKAKRQYLVTYKVSRYCLLALQCSVVFCVS